MKVLRRNGERPELVKLPFESRLDLLKDELESAFDRMWRTFGYEPWLPAFKQWETTKFPPLDVIEDEQGVMIELDVPGFGPKELEVEIEGKYLVIRGIREENLRELPEKKPLVRHERHLANFERMIPIPEYIDPEKIEAKYEKGMLILRLPRLPGKQPKKITIKT